MLRSNPSDHAVIAAAAAEVAAAAGDVLLEHLDNREQLVVRDKAGPGETQDLVTSADHAADSFLRERLPEIVRVPYWSEETGNRPPADTFWLVDPLDGTHNFFNGLPLFGVSVALVTGGQTVAAALDFPALGLALRAASGAGAWSGEHRLSVTARRQAEWMLEVNAQPSEADQLSNLLRLSSGVRAVRVFGSIALSLAYVALGSLDLWVGRGYPWDVAAGTLIVAEAGGVSLTTERQTRDIFTRDLTLAGHRATVGAALTQILAA